MNKSDTKFLSYGIVNIIVDNNVNNNQVISGGLICERDQSGYSSERIFSEIITSGGTDNLIKYCKRSGLNNDPEIVVLSSPHYYYDKNDLKNVRILINLNKLNLIKRLDVFLNTLVHILPQNTNFIGFFSDNNSLYENEFPLARLSRLFHRLNNFFCINTDYYITKSEVIRLLKSNGFEIVNMINMNGLTYFTSYNRQKLHT